MHLPLLKKSSLAGFYHSPSHFALCDSPFLALLSAVMAVAIFQQSATVPWGSLYGSAVPQSPEVFVEQGSCCLTGRPVSLGGLSAMPFCPTLS